MAIDTLSAMSVGNIRPMTRGSTTFLPYPEPRPIWCPMVSADDHVLEPRDMFEGRVPQALADAVPRIVEDDEGVPYWQIEEHRVPIITSNGAVGRPMNEWTMAPQKFEEFAPGVTDVHARLRDMDFAGMYASLCFPSIVWGFAGTILSKMRNQEAGLAAVRAYNDWHLEEWCGAAPERFIPCQMPWMADPVIGGEEIRRNAERGYKSVTFSENPEGLGLPHLYDRHWDPFFAACAETGTVVNLHIGSSGSVTRPSSVSPAEVMTALFPINGILSIVDWIYSKVPVRHPELVVVMSEAGVTWVPMVIERLRRAYRQVDSSMVWTADDPDPVDVLRRNFRFTSIEDPAAFHQLHLIGEDVVMVETDYPHQDSTWPDSQTMLKRDLAHLPEATARKIAYGNACSIYRHPLPGPEFFENAELSYEGAA